MARCCCCIDRFEWILRHLSKCPPGMHCKRCRKTHHQRCLLGNACSWRPPAGSRSSPQHRECTVPARLLPQWADSCRPGMEGRWRTLWHRRCCCRSRQDTWCSCQSSPNQPDHSTFQADRLHNCQNSWSPRSRPPFPLDTRCRWCSHWLLRCCSRIHEDKADSSQRLKHQTSC